MRMKPKPSALAGILMEYEFRQTMVEIRSVSALFKP
jgi:hypothetical protein